MTVEELRREAKALGYNIIPISAPPEKLLPCVCGCKRRSHWVTYVQGEELEILKCEKCGREAYGKTDKEVRHNWNEMVREIRHETN